MPGYRQPPKYLTGLVRLQGAMLSVAVLPILMPTEWMIYLHTQLQLGDLPIAPIVEYLTRSVSAVYAMHGVLLLFISFDLAKYRSLLGFLILVHGLHGTLMLGIDLWAGMPWWWSAGEGPPIMAFAAILGVLYRRWPLESPQAAEH